MVTQKNKATKTEEKSVAYSTRYGTYDGTVLDGNSIARNNAQFYKMYRVNTDIRRAIKEKQETSMKSGYEIHSLNASTGEQNVVQAPEFELAMERSGGLQEVKNKILKSLDLFGYCFVRRVYNVRGVKNYAVLDSRYVTVVTDEELNILRVIYKNPALKGKVENYSGDDMISIMDDSDLDNPVFGISPLETIVVDVLGDEEASLSNHAYFANDGIPSALYVLKDGLTADQQKQIYTQIQETLKGGHNKHKSLASSAIVDLKTISNNHTDANFENQRKMATLKVCVALGVPRTILGYVEDVNMSNGDNQYKKFIENTIRPIERKLKDIFTIFLHDFDDYKKLSFSINDEHIDDYEQRCKLARDNVLGGLWSRNRALQYIGDEANDDELADELTVTTTTRLLSDLLNGSSPDITGTATQTADQISGKKSENIQVKITHITK